MVIPASVDEFTPPWLSEALGADVRSVEVLDAHSGTTGRAKIRIQTSADLPETLFVKLRPFDQEQRDFLAMIGLGVSEAKFRRLAELYIARNRDIGSLWNEGERTLIHGDDHIGNLFVDRGRTGFYDWAVASRSPGMRDVAYFLCNSLPTEVRRREEDALLRRYLAGLAAGGITLDASLAHEQYRLFSIYSWIAATTTAAMGSKWQPVEVGRRATERTTQAIIDLDVLGLLAERLGASS